MRNLKALALAFLVSALASPLFAQDAYLAALARYMSGETVQWNQTAEDVNVALIVKYIGTDVGTNSVAVAATGEISFIDAGTAGADVSVICPSGGTGGTIDVTDAACNTLGEVVDIINADANWAAVIHAGLRSDSSDNTLLVKTAAVADVAEGLNLEWDSDVANHVTFVLSDVSDFLDYSGGRDGALLTNPFNGVRAVFVEMNYNVDFSASAGSLTIYSVAVNPNAGTETVNTVFGAIALTDGSETLFDRKPFGIFGRKNQKLLVRLLDGGTLAGVTLVTAYGSEFRSR